MSSSRFLALTILIVLFLVAAQCNAPVSTTPPTPQTGGVLEAVSFNGQKLNVIATTSIVADIVRNVGGEAISLSTLLPLGADPHAFEPTPADLAKISAAHVIFANGMGLEEFLTEMVENAGGQAPVIEVSNGVTARHFADEPAHTEGEAEEQAGHHHEGADPHTWTSPANVKVFAGNIEQALSALDPANAATYKANAQVYIAQLDDLDSWVKAQIETVPAENRNLVTDHTAFGYYADRYGLAQVGAVIPSFTTVAEPSVRELAQLQDVIGQHKIKAVFVAETVNPELSERLARDTGVALVTLYGGSLGQPGSGAETYLDYIRYNTQAIVGALR